MAKRLNLFVDYDEWGDVLNVFLGKPYSTDNVDINTHITLRFNYRTKKLVGLVILEFSLLFPGIPPKSRPLAAQIIFKLFEQLYGKTTKVLKAA